MLDGQVLGAFQVEYKPFGKPPLKREPDHCGKAARAGRGAQDALLHPGSAGRPLGAQVRAGRLPAIAGRAGLWAGRPMSTASLSATWPAGTGTSLRRTCAPTLNFVKWLRVRKEACPTPSPVGCGRGCALLGPAERYPGRLCGCGGSGAGRSEAGQRHAAEELAGHPAKPRGSPSTTASAWTWSSATSRCATCTWAPHGPQAPSCWRRPRTGSTAPPGAPA